MNFKLEETAAVVRGALFAACLASVLLMPGLERAAFAAPKAPAKVDPEKGKVPFPRPLSHTSNWSEYHGRSVEPSAGAASGTGTNCITCHEKTDCVACHNVQAPRDHTNTWRTMSHGLMAGGDRERCQTCHRQDFCVRCHNETAPRSHVGGWKTRHCTWCHFASGFTPDDGCAVCHRKAPHTSAPHPVKLQVDCTQCHK